MIFKKNKRAVFIVFLLHIGMIYGQSNYVLNKNFLLDKNRTEKVVRRKIEQQFPELTSYDIKFLYYFNCELVNLTKAKLENNTYLNEIEPIYVYTNRLRSKRKQVLSSIGFVYSKENEVVLCSIISYSTNIQLLERFHERYINIFNDVISRVENENSIIFRLPASTDILWCLDIDEKKTYIYDGEKKFPLVDYYMCCWSEYCPYCPKDISLPPRP